MSNSQRHSFISLSLIILMNIIFVHSLWYVRAVTQKPIELRGRFFCFPFEMFKISIRLSQVLHMRTLSQLEAWSVTGGVLASAWNPSHTHADPSLTKSVHLSRLHGFGTTFTKWLKSLYHLKGWWTIVYFHLNSD